MYSRENLYKNYIARLNDDPSEQNSYEDNRLPAQIDLCRLIHSFPFRKLQGKKQLFGINIGDFHRTRLTHSYEVASIARGILDKIISDEPKNAEGDFNTDETTEIYDLFGQDSKLHKFKEATFDHKKLMNVYDHIRAAALAHDIGHPPYGHGGESALNYMMQNDKDCGFEGNAQNLRILSPLNPLENMFNLTRRTLLAVIKYPVTYSRIKSYKSVKNNQCECKNRLIKPSKYKPPKCIYDNYQGTLNNLLSGFSEDDSVLFQEIYLDKSQKKSKFKTFDCSIIELADDIAYSTHDLEDAIMLGIVDWEQCCDTLSSDKAEVKYIDKKLRKIDNNYSIKNMFKKDHTAKKIFGRLINILIQDISFVITTKKFHDPLLKYNVAFIHREVSKFIGLLQEIVKEKVINSVESKTYERGGLILIMRLFETINADPKSLLPKEEQDKYIQNAQNTHQQRVVCDYIAGMTDEYAFKLHKRLFGYDPGSFFEKLSF